jgi:hypothetical protein
MRRIGDRRARWGTGDTGFSESTRVFALRNDRSRGAWQPSRAPPRCVTSQAGFEPALSSAKYPTSSPPASVQPQHAANRNTKKNLCGALKRAAICKPLGVCSAIGIRLAPRSLRQAPRFGHAPAGASPGIRVSRSGLRREISNEPWLRTTKNPPERLAREGPCKADDRFRLREIAPMSRTSASDWPEAIRQPDELFASVGHQRTHVCSRTQCS